MKRGNVNRWSDSPALLLRPTQTPRRAGLGCVGVVSSVWPSEGLAVGREGEAEVEGLVERQEEGVVAEAGEGGLEQCQVELWESDEGSSAQTDS